MSTLGALKGAGFAAALVILVFFLKIICPLDTGCLADPFVLVIFSPLSLFGAVGLSPYVSTTNEPFIILAFWTMVGLIVGYLVHPLIQKENKD